jgi:hypothetical protein
MADSRIAEVATELMGATAVADFFRRAWETASEESRREISDAILAKVLEAVRAAKPWDSFSRGGLNEVVSREVNALVARDAERVVGEHRDAIKKAYEERVVAVTRGVAKTLADEATERVARTAVDAVSSAIREALKKV